MHATDAAVAAVHPVCELSGRCCRFAEYGHDLFLSQLEARYLLQAGRPDPATLSPAGCPYQVGKLCTAREFRPLGCRTYFCDPSYAERMPEITEVSIRALKQMHDRLEIPWRYARLDRALAIALEETA